MRILWICALPLELQDAAFGGEAHGAQVAASWILAHLPPPSDIDLHIACLWPGGDRRKMVEFQGTKVHLLPCPRRGRSILLFQRDTSYFQSLFTELRPDVVHGWGTEDSFGLVARRLAPSHHVIGIQGLIRAYRKHAHMDPRTTLTAITEKWTLARARVVVAESAYAAREASALCPSSTRFEVIEHPLRREFLASTPSTGTATQAVFVGALQQRKGVSDALQAFAGAAPPDWRLQIVGAGSEEEERTMSRLVNQLQLRDRCAHLRFCNAAELVGVIQASSILLLPTLIDTGPTALKEALTMTLWPVCYDNSGPGEYVRKYGWGSLATSNDVRSLTETLRQTVERHPWQQPSERAALAERTRRDFSPATAWAHLTACYHTVASGK